MAKSVSSLLLAVLLVAVSLHSAHRVSARGEVAPRGGPRVHGLPAAEEKKVIEAQKTFSEKLAEAELEEKIDGLSDLIESVIEHYKEDQQLPEGFHYFTVTGIMVGGRTLEISKGVAILSSKTFTFLNKEAFELVTNEFPASKPLKSGMLCIKDGSTADSVTLLFAGGNKFEYRWNKQSDVFMFLPILPLQ